MSIKLMVRVWDEIKVEMTGTECAILTQLADHANDEGRSCYPSIERIARRCRLSNKAVSNNLKSLEQKGLIEIIRKAGKVHHYVLLFAQETPEPSSVVPQNEVPETPEPSSDEPLITTKEPTEERMKRLEGKLGKSPLDTLVKHIEVVRPIVPFHVPEELKSIIDGFAYVWNALYGRQITKGMKKKWTSQALQIKNELGEVPADLVVKAGEDHQEKRDQVGNPLSLNGPSSLLYRIRELMYDPEPKKKDYNYGRPN